MSFTPPPPRPHDPARPQLPNLGRWAKWIALLTLIPAVVVVVFLYVWYVQRIEVNAGNVLVLVRKVGEPLPSVDREGQPLPEAAATQVVLYPELLAALGEEPDSTRYKGIRHDVLTEGRYFYDPFFWERRVVPAIVIEQDEVGILVRKFGRRLSADQTVATQTDERGPLAEVLEPGRYNINPYAYDVKRYKQVRIPAGRVGVQILLHGEEPADPNNWVVAKGERGVQPDVLPPGLYFNNPYMRRIELIDVRSHTLDLRQDDAIRFPSSDSFEIVLEATVEYAISQDQAPYVMVAIGDHQDIEEKLILPYARSLSRIEGSKLLAKEFISGQTREEFQNAFFENLRDRCAAQGIEIRATPIRQIEPPAAIANPISDRQLADQQIQQYQNEIKVAESQARLVEQEEMQKQNLAIGEAERGVVTVIMEAEQEKAVALTEANKRLEVTRLGLEAARERAEAIRSRGQADAEVVTLNYKAEAEPLREAVNAFGTGDVYAQYYFYEKLAPALKSVLASTDGPFADIFRSLSENTPLPASAPTEGGGQ